MPHILIVVWIAYSGSINQDPRSWNEVTMQEFSSKETCAAAAASVRESAPRVGTECIKK